MEKVLFIFEMAEKLTNYTNQVLPLDKKFTSATIIFGNTIN